MLFCSVARTVASARRALVITCVLQGTLQTIAALGNGGMDLQREVLSCACIGCSWMALAAALVMAEPWLFLTLACCGGAQLLVRVFSDCWVFGDCANLVEERPVVATTVLAAGALFPALRRRSLRRILARIQTDRAMYDMQWERLASDPQWQEELARIESLAAAAGGGPPPLSPRCDRDEVRHLRPNAAPVTNLDQIYSQALLMVPVLHRRCTSWARMSCGRTSVPNGDPLPDMIAKADDPSGVWPATLDGWVRQGLLKPPLRAVRKAHLCYAGDVSRLVDVCRHRICFDDVGGVRACLELILSEAPVVRVLRVKNSLDRRHNGGGGGSACDCGSGGAVPPSGFRGVVINMTVDNELTRTLGLHLHVCEVILATRPWALDSDAPLHRAAHTRYHDFRAMRPILTPPPPPLPARVAWPSLCWPAARGTAIQRPSLAPANHAARRVSMVMARSASMRKMVSFAEDDGTFVMNACHDGSGGGAWESGGMGGGDLRLSDETQELLHQAVLSAYRETALRHSPSLDEQLDQVLISLFLSLSHPLCYTDTHVHTHILNPLQQAQNVNQMEAAMRAAFHSLYHSTPSFPITHTPTHLHPHNYNLRSCTNGGYRWRRR